MGEQDVRVTGTAPNPLQDRTFLSVSVTEGGRPRPLVPGTRIRLAFTGDGINAQAGCNTLFVPVTVDASSVVVTGQVISALIGCDAEGHAQDEWLAAFLVDDPGYAFTGGSLTLTRGSTEIVLVSKELM